jgi:hypothetical protein
VRFADDQPVFGIDICMYHRDHPPAHFHAYYGDQHAVIDIETLAVREGKLNRRVMSLVLEWASEHRDELLADWELTGLRLPLNPIDPLE